MSKEPKIFDTTQRILIHHYHPDDHSYQCSSPYLVVKDTGLPANATEIRPEGEPGENQAFVFVESESRWELREDHRGKPVWRKSGGGNQKPKIIELVGPISESYTEKQPATPQDRYDIDADEWVTDMVELKAAAQLYIERPFQNVTKRALDSFDIDHDDLAMLMFAESQWKQEGSDLDDIPAEYIDFAGDDVQDNATIVQNVTDLISGARNALAYIKSQKMKARKAIRAGETIEQVYAARDQAVSFAESGYGN